MGQRIIIMAGGTGGHVFPALAVGEYLLAKNWDVSWIGTHQGMENKIVPDSGIEMDCLSVQGLRGKGLGAKINNVLLLIQAFWQAFLILRKRKPDVVLGMGGYVAGPGGLMAWLMNIPLVIHEQNRVPGTTNRLLVNKANKVLEAFPGSFIKTKKAIFTGNPLRKEFVDFPAKSYWTKDSERAFRIFILGGSQGAKALNDVIPKTLSSLENVEIKHQTGKASISEVAQQYKELSVNAEAIEFIDDMAAAYEWADMIICRAGAMTVSEVAAVGLPAIFIPLPTAIDDHQAVNARYLVEAGAAKLIVQNSLNEGTLLMTINELKKSLAEIGCSAKSKAKIDATAVVADICTQVATA